MNCNEIQALIEEYIMGELGSGEKTAVENHLQVCASCSCEFSKSMELISRLRGLRKDIKVREDIMDINKRNIFKKTGKAGAGFGKGLPLVAACVFFALFVISSSFVAFPALAYKYAPELPVVKELVQIRTENKKIREQVDQVQLENEQLKQQLKNINGTELIEIETSKGIPAAENTAIQALVIDFIKAQYKGDLEAIKGMCTVSFRKQVERQKDELIGDKSGDIVFSTITNVAKEGEKYLVFVRLNDTGKQDDADYQEDFEIVKLDGKFLVDFVGKDA